MPRAVTADPETLVIRSTRCCSPDTGLGEVVDVVIERGVISRLGRDAGASFSSSAAVRQFDGHGHWLLPGLVDLHAHLREPGQEYKEDIASGLRAAAAGGYVDVCVMPNTKPVNDTRSVTELMVRRAQQVVGARLHPIGAITMGLQGKQLTEMADLKEAGAVAVSDDGVCVMNAAVMRHALEYARNFELPLMQHAEDHDLTHGAEMHEGAVSARLGLRGWPSVAEEIIIARDLLLSEYTKAHYHAAHISTRGTVRLLHDAKDRGIRATCEVTPHHLLLTDAALLGYDTHCKVNPPLREQEDADALLEALDQGIIDVIATDHAPHSPIEKDCEFVAAAPGMMGLELCLPLLMDLVHKGRLKLERLVSALTVGPARIAGLPIPRLAEGAPANLALYDPQECWTPGRANLNTKSLNSPFIGKPVTGRVRLTVADGRIIFQASGQEK